MLPVALSAALLVRAPVPSSEVPREAKRGHWRWLAWRDDDKFFATQKFLQKKVRIEKKNNSLNIISEFNCFEVRIAKYFNLWDT